MTASGRRRPNILILLNDHQPYYRHGWDAGPRVQRPHFDRLAREGAVFERAYCAAPLCAPARRSLLTGVAPHKHGEIKNDVCHPFDRPTFPELLAESGYRTSWIGKWHAGPGTAADIGCRGFSYPSYSNPYTKPEYQAYLRRRELPEPEILIERSFEPETHGTLEGTLYRQERNWSNEHALGVLQTPVETHEAYFLADLAATELSELAADPEGEPFFLFVSFWGPHAPYFPTQEFLDRYDPSEIAEYGNFRTDLDTKPEVYRREANAPIGVDDTLVQPNPLPWQEWQQVLAHAYAQTTLVDAAGGLILDTLDELGIADNTLVLWTTDHGDAVASHGGHFDKRSYLPEEMTRIPFVLRWPDRVAPEQVRRELVGQVDVFPTVLDAAGVSVAGEEGSGVGAAGARAAGAGAAGVGAAGVGAPGEVDGVSLLPWLCDGVRSTRQEMVTETFGHGEDLIGRAMVTDRYKYVLYEGIGEEFYDLLTDPYELRNLVHEPEFEELLIQMRDRLRRWRRENDDVGQEV